jgi:hypothetical protein
MSKFTKAITCLLVIMITTSCVNHEKENQIVEEKTIPSPVNIKRYLKYNQKIDTIKLKPDSINYKLGLNYHTYYRYTARLNRSIKDWHCCGDYLVTGIDDNGKENFVHFFTMYPNKGTEIWNKILIRQPKEYVFKYLGTPIIMHKKTNQFYSTHKDGYNFLMHVNTASEVWRIFISASNKNFSTEEQSDLRDLFYP